MQKVVDSNFLQDQELRAYLDRSNNNYVVLIDYAWMEAYKGNTLRSIFKSMAILADFPRQVIVLKGTKAVSSLSGRRSGLTRRMMWPNGTREFVEFCAHIKAVSGGEAPPSLSLQEHGRAASEHMDNILSDAKHMVETFSKIARIYTPEEIRIIRTGGILTKEIVHKTLNEIHEIALVLRDKFSNIAKSRNNSEFQNTFLFRYSLCTYLVLLNWIRQGGQRQIKAEKVRNDMVDANFATFATYFDGILTNDRKLQKLHGEARVILKLLGTPV